MRWNSNNKSLSELSKTTFKKDLTELSANIKSFTKTIKDLKNDSGFNKLLTNKELYTSSASTFDTANQKIKEVKENPQPITILGK